MTCSPEVVDLVKHMLGDLQKQLVVTYHLIVEVNSVGIKVSILYQVVQVQDLYQEVSVAIAYLANYTGNILQEETKKETS